MTAMDTPVQETSTDDNTVWSVDERIKQATEPILRGMEELRALLASRTETGNREASSSKRKHEFNSRSRNHYDTRFAQTLKDKN